jgi:prophage regulatory protein
MAAKLKCFLRRRKVEETTGLSTSSIYDQMSKGLFPRPIKLSENRVAWLEDEVEAWMTARIAERDTTAGKEKAEIPPGYKGQTRGSTRVERPTKVKARRPKARAKPAREIERHPIP